MYSIPSWSKHRYDSVAAQDDCFKDESDSVLEDTVPVKRPATSCCGRRGPQIHLNFTGGLLLLVSAAALVWLSVELTAWHYRQTTRPMEFTPLPQMIDISYHTKPVFVETLLNKSDPAYTYRKPPGPEVDEAWERLGKPGLFPISRADVIKMGKDPRYAVQAPDFFKWPEDSFIGTMQSVHNIHCLNTVRKNLLSNYHYYWGFRFGFKPNVVWEYHVQHCLDMLRQSMMCNADLSVFTYNWREGQEGIYADFSTPQKCVNFDAIVELNDHWREDMKDRFKGWASIPRPDPNPYELPGPPDLPMLNENTTWKYITTGDQGWVATGPIAGFEGKDYCLGDIDGSAVDGDGPD